MAEATGPPLASLLEAFSWHSSYSNRHPGSCYTVRKSVHSVSRFIICQGVILFKATGSLTPAMVFFMAKVAVWFNIQVEVIVGHALGCGIPGLQSSTCLCLRLDPRICFQERLPSHQSLCCLLVLERALLFFLRDYHRCLIALKSTSILSGDTAVGH